MKDEAEPADHVPWRTAILAYSLVNLYLNQKIIFLDELGTAPPASRVKKKHVHICRPSGFNVTRYK